MASDRNKILIESVKRLLRRNAFTHLSRIVNKTHAADLSAVFSSLSLPQQQRLFSMIKSIEQKGALFSVLEQENLLDLIKDIDIDHIVEIVNSMASDDVADLLGRLPEEEAKAILDKMGNKDSQDLEHLLGYDDDTAGGIMVTEFIALKEDITAGEAIASLQKEYQNVEMPFYLYVIDEYGNLVGVSSLRQLVVVPPEKPLKDFMTTDVFSVTTDTDQEEVAQIVAHYDILAVPVVDDTNKLVGIVTVDDVIDILREEATEDMLKMAGVGGEEFVETKSIPKSVKIRLPWLIASCIGGIITSFIIGHFEKTLSELVYMAAFIPIVMGMGGNIGTQSSTIVVRGLATGRLNIRDVGAVVLKEITIGLALGVLYGSVVGAVAQLKHSGLMLALAVGGAVLSSMTAAALLGSIVPMAFARINIDPAVATGPLVSTSVDMLSVSLYFIIAVNLI